MEGELDVKARLRSSRCLFFAFSFVAAGLASGPSFGGNAGAMNGQSQHGNGNDATKVDNANGNSANGNGVTVQTAKGTIRGYKKSGVNYFLGIPYAKPPVGKLRWANPVSPDRWSGVRDATRYGNFCAQNKDLGDFGAPGTDEDCLYLNVFTPNYSIHNPRRLPVMFWMHGGGNTGSGNQYDGSTLAKEQNVVVVTINFRLGALGYLFHPALDDGGATAQFWLRDQQFAMGWVRDNIENFGGDRNNVTIFGESYGGEDTLSHIISPAAKGLFQKAIMESGPSNYFSRLVPLAEAEERGKAFATSIGCPDQTAACLRKVPVKTILDAQSYFRGPVNDGHVITSSPYDAIRSGRFNRVPIFDVTNHDEDRWFVAFDEVSSGHVITADEYPAQLQASFGSTAAAVQKLYPLRAFDSPSGALAAAQTDRGYPCQVRSLDVDAARHTAVYGAEFNDPKSPGILPPVSFPLLASHTHEIQYIFAGWKGVYQGKVTPFTRQQSKLAKDMRAIWATFARSGRLPIPRIVNNNYLILSLEPSGIRLTGDFYRDHKCGFWNSVRNWAPVGSPMR